MKKFNILFGFATALFLFSCGEPTTQTASNEDATAQTDDNAKPAATGDFKWNPENFADKKIVRYQIPGFENLSLKQKKLVYYLTQAGYAGRDIAYDQNYRHNIAVRRVLDKIASDYKGERSGADWDAFMLYAKNVWFSSGIHHHYSSDKFEPGFSKEYFEGMMKATGQTLNADAMTAMFDPSVDPKKVSLNPDKDLVLNSAVNFYGPDITEADVDAYYKSIMKKGEKKAVSYGLNSKLVKKNGKVVEEVYKVGGLYGKALEQKVMWLNKAAGVAENEAQGNALKLLIKFYETGDLKVWDEYNIAWVQATEGDIDYIDGFVEVYQDPKGYTGSSETVVQIKDFDASARMKVVADNGQWFEDNSSTMKAHKKDKVVGISYKVVAVAGEAGDASPSTPIGVNLPNSNWIRAEYGSKSVSLGNIIAAYANADGPGMLTEFAHDAEEIERAKKYSQLGSKMHTALHEVIGHASGKLEDDVATPKETLKNYASPLEEARADLVALYFLPDAKMMDLGLVDSEDVAKAEYDSYIRNGMMLQLRRIVPGNIIEQAHMRNRAMVAHWAFEKGQADKVIEKVIRDGKTYWDIKDYNKLRDIFGQLLMEVQRVKSQGDYEAGKKLIEDYGVQVDTDLHAEVLKRSEVLKIPPYGGFINPKLVPVTNDKGEITDVKVEYPADFAQQMIDYGKEYSFLPDVN